MTVEPLARTGARVLLLDPDGRVLLIHERIEVGNHWLTPGGGVEAGESLPIAAARELYEETSIRIDIDPDEPAIHQLERVWHWRGASYRQTDNFFVVRLGRRPEIVPAAPTAMEQETLLGFRWWSIEELAANTTEVIEPADLADLLRRLDRLVPPAA